MAAGGAGPILMTSHGVYDLQHRLVDKHILRLRKGGKIISVSHFHELHCTHLFCQILMVIFYFRES